MKFNVDAQDAPYLSMNWRDIIYDVLLKLYEKIPRSDVSDFGKIVDATFSNRKIFNQTVKTGIICSKGPLTVYSADPDEPPFVYDFNNLMFDEKKSMALDSMAYSVKKRVDIISRLSGVRSQDTRVDGYVIALNNVLSHMNDEPTIYDITPYEFAQYFAELANHPV